MINETKTMELFGYQSIRLTLGSHKPIIATCDYCDADYECDYKNLLTGRKKAIQKDACKKCKYVKVKECNAARPERAIILEKAKEKRAQTNLEKFGVEYYCQTEIGRASGRE